MKNFFYKVVVGAFVAFLQLSSVAHAENTLTGPNMLFGINGHPLNGDSHAAYFKVSAAAQIALVKSMGMNVYRFDAMSKSNGEVTVPYLMNPLLKEMKNNNIIPLVMLYPRTMDFSKTEQESYQMGLVLGGNFAARYKDDIKYYELGNEIDNLLVYPGKTGKSQEHIDPVKFKVVAAYLKGMNDGIKANDPDAQTMINAGWLHYAYLRMLEWYGIKFDIIGYHWYSDMEVAAAKQPHNIEDITKKLSELFPKKPIWITEINAQPKLQLSDEINERAQAIFLVDFIKKARQNPQVKAIIVYGLLDEFHRGGKEAHYGLTKWINDRKFLTNKYAAYFFGMHKK